MKIVHLLLGKANPERLNGVNRVVHAVATAQYRSGRNVEVWGLTRTPEAATPPHVYPLRLFHACSWRFALDPALKAAIREFPRDGVFHFHGALIPELTMASRVLARRGIPWVVTPHGAFNPPLLRRRSYLKRPYIALLERAHLRGSRALQALTAAEREMIRREVIHPHVVVIPNGQDLAAVSHDGPLPERPQRPVFGFCGRLDSETKGLDLLLTGFARYRESGGNGALWLIGDGPSRSRLEKQAESLGLDDYIRFLGIRSGNDKLSHIAAMDVFVHTSRWEGMPMAVLEAAALARPLLISRETNMADDVLHADCGVVLKNNDAEDISRAMTAMAQRFAAGDLDTMGQRAQDMIRRDFDWATIARRLSETLYCPRVDPS